MVAKDVMSKKVITVASTTSVKELAKLLMKHEISGAPVVDKRGNIVGVVSEADILGKKGKEVKTIMSKKIVKVSEDTPVERIAILMTTHKIKRVPVMRGDKLLGIVSRADLIEAIALGKHIALHTPVYDL